MLAPQIAYDFCVHAPIPLAGTSMSTGAAKPERSTASATSRQALPNLVENAEDNMADLSRTHLNSGLQDQFT
jgi:hypothetical protein